MAYQGYRLKINNVVFPNEYVSRGTYKISRNPRKVETYTDIVGVEHDVFYPTDKTTITFMIREHSSSDHSTIYEYFSTRKNVTVEYYDDNTDTYISGTFRVDKITWEYENALSNTIEYAPTPITLEEY